MEEEDTREKKVGKIVHCPANQKDTTTCPEVGKLGWGETQVHVREGEGQGEGGEGEGGREEGEGGRGEGRERDSPLFKSYTCRFLLIV